MSQRVAESRRVVPLIRRYQAVRFPEAGPSLVLGAVLALISGCQTEKSCHYRCTAVEDACPSGLSCDVTLGYCVSPDYSGTCDAETREVTVCANEPVELKLPDDFEDPEELEGLPEDAVVQDGILKAVFPRKGVLAFGGPAQDRQFWNIKTTSDCPTLDEAFPVLCVGQEVNQTLHGAGGVGRLAFELMTETDEFSLSSDGVLSGAAKTVGQRALRIGITDERGVRKTGTLEINVSNECGEVDMNLPKSCAGWDYEAALQIAGRAPVDVADFTPTRKDGKGLNSSEAEHWQKELDVEVVRRGSSYVLTASPSEAALGNYLFGLKLQNEVGVQQEEVPFGVTSCANVQADFTFCEGDDFDVDLAGADGDVWHFYDLEDPLRAQVQFVNDRRLRGKLVANGAPYSVKARVENARLQVQRLVTLTLAVESSASTACVVAEAGASESTSESSSVTSGNASSETETDTESTSPPSLPAGCVGRPYQFVVPPNGIVQGSWAAALPDGLSIDEEGIIQGVPSAGFDGWVDIGGLRGSSIVSEQYHFTVHEWCSVVFEGLPESSTRNRLYLADRRADIATVELSDEVDAGHDVTAFTVSPDRRHVAYAVQSASTGASQVRIRRLTDLPGGSTEPYFTGPIDSTTIDGAVYELNWDDADHVALLVRSGAPDGGTVETMFVYRVAKSAGGSSPTKKVEKRLLQARDLVWAGQYPCVSFAELPVVTNYGSVCINPSTGAATEGPNISIGLDGYQVRSHEGRLLQVQPRGEAFVVLTSWFPFPSVNDVEDVLHAARFASPSGALVGTTRGPADSEMEIALASDPTIYDSDAGHNKYVPLARIPNCSGVDTWGSSLLACSLGDADDDELVTVARASELAVSPLDPFSAPGHALSGQRTFVGENFYVFDDLLGRLNYVDLTTTPPTVRRTTLPSGSPVALAAVGSNRVVVQSADSLHVATFAPGNTVETALVANAPTPAGFPGCETAFGWNAFENWCGGDMAPRRFQVAPDGDLGAYLTADGEISMFSTEAERLLKTVDGIRVPCGGHPFCLTSFKITR